MPRTADGKPDLQGICSLAILTPRERPGNEAEKTEFDESTRAELEDAAQQRQIDLRTEPTNTPPGEKQRMRTTRSGETVFGSKCR
jgi:hypothetical protein